MSVPRTIAYAATLTVIGPEVCPLVEDAKRALKGVRMDSDTRVLVNRALSLSATRAHHLRLALVDAHTAHTARCSCRGNPHTDTCHHYLLTQALKETS